MENYLFYIVIDCAPFLNYTPISNTQVLHGQFQTVGHAAHTHNECTQLLHNTLISSAHYFFVPPINI